MANFMGNCAATTEEVSDLLQKKKKTNNRIEECARNILENNFKDNLRQARSHASAIPLGLVTTMKHIESPIMSHYATSMVTPSTSSLEPPCFAMHSPPSKDPTPVLCPQLNMRQFRVNERGVGGGGSHMLQWCQRHTVTKRSLI